MTAPAFPSDLPCPLIDGTSSEADPQLLRTSFEGGSTRQRRRNSRLPHVFQIAWLVKQRTDYGRLVSWLNTNGWSWFRLNLPSALAGGLDKDTVPHTVRLITPLSADLTPTKGDEHSENGVSYWWRVSCQVEWDIEADRATGFDFLAQGVWILADQAGPGAPAVDWILAGTADAPAADWVIPGTPSVPTVVV